MRRGKCGAREEFVLPKELLRRALTDHLTAREDDHGICHAQDVLHAVRYEYNADATLPVQHREHGEQRLASARVESRRRLIEHDPAAASRELDEVITLARGALTDVRSTVTRLRSPDLASQVEATRTALSAARIRVEVTGSAQDIPERQRALMAWALREATTNVVRHAKAATVAVHLEPGLLRVSDDGVGLAGDKPGNGLEGLRSRIEQEGGSLTMTSPITRRTGTSGDVETDSADMPSGGTRLEVRLP